MVSMVELHMRHVSEKGWVVIPQDLREKYGLEKGTPVRFVDYGGVVAIVPLPRDPVASGYGLLRGRNLTAKLLEEHAREQMGDGSE